jgi:methionine-R-sulfoxide reductase
MARWALGTPSSREGPRERDLVSSLPERNNGARKGVVREQEPGVAMKRSLALAVVFVSVCSGLLVFAGLSDATESEGSAKMYKRPSDEELRQRLTPLQWKVTQEDGTERAFQNEYWDNKRDGIYVDIVSGEPLFSSNEKYRSGTGWPSFWAPLEKDNIVEKVDRKLFMTRTEIRSKNGDAHLGHVFPDGPKPTGQRYCMNSASLRFIPVEDLEAEGYGEYLELFEGSSAE